MKTLHNHSLNQLLNYSILANVGIAVLVALAVLTLTSCNININNVNAGIIGNGNVTTTKRTIDAFDAITIEGSVNVDIVCKQSPGIEITTDENIIPYIRTVVVGTTLKIYVENNLSFRPTRNISVKVSAVQIRSLSRDGSGNTTLAALETPTFVLVQAGSGNADVQASVQTLTASIIGSGNINLQGSSQTTIISLSGSGNIDARRLLAAQATARIDGSGNINVYASQTLDATIAGSGNIFYFGNPPTVRRSISGSGNIRSRQ